MFSYWGSFSRSSQHKTPRVFSFDWARPCAAAGDEMKWDESMNERMHSRHSWDRYKPSAHVPLSQLHHSSQRLLQGFTCTWHQSTNTPASKIVVFIKHQVFLILSLVFLSVDSSNSKARATFNLQNRREFGPGAWARRRHPKTSQSFGERVQCTRQRPWRRSPRRP